MFSWGILAPVPGEKDTISPLEVGRSCLIRKVYAGFGAAVLVGAKRVEWVPGPQRPANTNIDRQDGIIETEKNDSRSLPGVEGVALGQNHTLLLRSMGEGDGVDPAGGKTQVLAWGSGRQGQVCVCVCVSRSICTMLLFADCGRDHPTFAARAGYDSCRENMTLQGSVFASAGSLVLSLLHSRSTFSSDGGMVKISFLYELSVHC